jgi:TPR repeat protein
MSHRNQTLLFFAVSVLVFLFYVKFDREKKNDESAEYVTPEATSQQPFDQGESPDQLIEQRNSDGGIVDRIKGKLQSGIHEMVDESFNKSTDSAIQWLTNIAAYDKTNEQPKDPLEQTVEQRFFEYYKCYPHGAISELPGDRVEIKYPVARGIYFTLSFEGGDICTGHWSPSVIAQHLLGAIYDQDDSLAQNNSEALAWYLKASEQGFPLSQYNLGVLYYNGDGTTQSYEDAARYFRKAADQGLSIAQNSLGDMYLYGQYFNQNYSEAMKWYLKAAEQGNAIAQNNLGIMYENGYGVKANDSEAVKWYQKAANRKNVYAQYNLGNIFTKHHPDQHDFNKALRWYRKAAENGHALSQKVLGIMYQMGRGTEPNPAEAVKWFKKAAEQGNLEAMVHLGYLYEHGLCEGQDIIKAKDIYLATIQKANSDSLFSIAEGWHNDSSQPNDLGMAYLWYRLAAHKGNKQGNDSCVYIAKDMTKAQISKAEEMSRQLIERYGEAK